MSVPGWLPVSGSSFTVISPPGIWFTATTASEGCESASIDLRKPSVTTVPKRSIRVIGEEKVQGGP